MISFKRKLIKISACMLAVVLLAGFLSMPSFADGLYGEQENESVAEQDNYSDSIENSLLLTEENDADADAVQPVTPDTEAADTEETDIDADTPGSEETDPEGTDPYDTEPEQFDDSDSEPADDREPVTVDSSAVVKKGGSKIHIIKIFTQAEKGSNAILVESDGHFGLVDVGIPYNYNFKGGLDVDNSVVNYLKNYGVKKLDFIAITHYHNDHCGNMDMILRTFPVSHVYARTFESPDYETVFPSRKSTKEICDEYGVPASLLTNEEIITLGSLTLKALNLDDELIYSENGNSLVLLVTDGYGHKALLTGDMDNYDGDEGRLVENYSEELEKVDFLEPGHHGHFGSSTYELIKMLNPLCVGVSGYAISEEEDPFRPGYTVLDNYSESKAYKNDQIYTAYDSENGIIFTMGKELSINDSFKKPSRTGNANKTLSIYYYADGGYIDDEHSEQFKVNEEGYICSLNSDAQTWKDYVQLAALDGDITPMYYYDRDRKLADADEMGLKKEGYKFTGNWYAKDDPETVFKVGSLYSPFDIEPGLRSGNIEIELVAEWEVDPDWVPEEEEPSEQETVSGQDSSETDEQDIGSGQSDSKTDEPVTPSGKGPADPGTTDRSGVSDTMPEIIKKSVFSDVADPSLYYYAAVIWAKNKGITKGYPDGTFGPKLKCTREQVVTFLWRLDGCPEPRTTKNLFKDIKPSKYYYKAVLWAAENGIAKGYADGTFRPDAPCLREHAVTFLWRYAGKPRPMNINSEFNDVNYRAYYYDAVLWANQNGIANGYSTGLYKGGFGPELPCLREHVITFFYRYYLYEARNL